MRIYDENLVIIALIAQIHKIITSMYDFSDLSNK